MFFLNRIQMACLLGLLACSTTVLAQDTATIKRAADKVVDDDESIAEFTKKYQAIDKLGYAEDNIKAAAQTLQAKLTSDDPQVRWRSARALGNLGSPAAAAVPSLVDLLEDKDPVVQLHAAIALARIGDKSEPTVDALVAQVASPDGRVARTAIQALRQLQVDPKRLAGAMEKVLETDDTAVMVYALEELVSAGPRAIPLLNAALAGNRSAYWASVAIGEMGPEAAACTDSLAAMLGKSKDSQTLVQGLIALAEIGPPARPAADAVQKLADATDDASVRVAASYAMGAIGDESATDLLRKFETTGGSLQKMVSAWSLSKLHPDDPDAQRTAISLLTQGLKSERPEVRAAAAEGLSKLGAPVEAVAPALVEALRGASDADKSNIADALASLGPAIVGPAVKALGDPELRDVAIEVLGRLGPQAADAVDGLAGQLSTDLADQIVRVQFALAEIGPEASEAADQIALNLQHKAEEVRQSALFALRQLGAEAEEAIVPLQQQMKSAEEEFERVAAAWALAKMKLNTGLLDQVTTTLMKSLDDPDEQVRLETISAIGDMNVGKAAFTEKLKAMSVNDRSPTVRAAAKKAVQ